MYLDHDMCNMPKSLTKVQDEGELGGLKMGSYCLDLTERESPILVVSPQLAVICETLSKLEKASKLARLVEDQWLPIKTENVLSFLSIPESSDEYGSFGILK